MAFQAKMKLAIQLFCLNPVNTMIEVIECKKDDIISLHMEVDIAGTDSAKNNKII